MRVHNTLKDAKVAHNDHILIGIKNDEEESKLEKKVAEKGADAAAETIYENTIIVNLAGHTEYERFVPELDWTVAQLLKYLE